MSKAILIVDMPKSCGDCIFSNPDGDYCPFLGCVTFTEFLHRRKEKCPLRELPERKDIAVSSLATHVHRAEGWNDCLDTITGECVCGDPDSDKCPKGEVNETLAGDDTSRNQ